MAAPAPAPPALSSPSLPPDDAPVEAEGDDYREDDDSALSVHDIGSSTTSITSSIMRHRQENGRRYHAYKDGRYLLPNDEEENDRLDLQHHLFLLTLNNRMHLCPIPEGRLHRVLDVGTGTGIWAIDFADDHPESEVLGVDLSPTQPSFGPPNVTFQIDDLDDTWTFGHKFDFIHSRMMTGALSNWPQFFQQAYNNLNPGGHIHVADSIFPLRSDDDTWPPDSALLKWSRILAETAEKIGRPADSARHYVPQMRAVGFQNVTESRYKWPLNRWPKDPKMKELGMWTHTNIAGGLSGISLAIFTRVLGWTPEEVEVFLVDVRKELRDTRIHAYVPIVVVTAEKPGSTAAPTPSAPATATPADAVPASPSASAAAPSAPPASAAAALIPSASAAGPPAVASTSAASATAKSS